MHSLGSLSGAQSALAGIGGGVKGAVGESLRHRYTDIDRYRDRYVQSRYTYIDRYRYR